MPLSDRPPDKSIQGQNHRCRSWISHLGGTKTQNPHTKVHIITSTNPLIRLNWNFFFGATSMMPKSNKLQRLLKSRSYLHCSFFQRLALICLSLNLTGIYVPGLALPLRIIRAPARKNPPGIPRQDNILKPYLFSVPLLL